MPHRELEPEIYIQDAYGDKTFFINNRIENCEDIIGHLEEAKTSLCNAKDESVFLLYYDDSVIKECIKLIETEIQETKTLKNNFEEELDG